ncbi:hypothetical protein [Scytonema sp. PRP1]
MMLVLMVVFVIADTLDMQPGVVFVAFAATVDSFIDLEDFALLASTTLR